MSNKHEYRSVFAPYISAFMKIKSAVVSKTADYGHTLKQWDDAMILNKRSELYVTKEMVCEWEKSLYPTSDVTSYHKHSQLIQFLKYLCRLGIECYVPRLPKRPSSTYTPYVYTHDEIIRIFAAIDEAELSRPTPKSCLMCMPCLFRLLYATGMRISEALSIRNEDVDFSNNFIILRKTKNNKERIIPMNERLKEVLMQYIKYRDLVPVEGISNPDRYLFVSGLGKPFSTNTPYTFFKRILEKCGIHHRGKNEGPRVHDLRHTFAVHTLHRMSSEDVDLYAGLPILSVMLGHASVKETEWYLRLAREFYPEIIEKMSATTGGVFPELDKNNMYHGKGN